MTESRLSRLFAAISVYAMVVLSWLLGPLTSLFWSAVFMAFVDIVTGVVAALENGEYDSSVCKRGLLKKIGMLVAVTAVYRLDVLAPSLSAVIPSFEVWEAPIRDLLLGVFVVNDFMSVFENLGKWGVELPKVITDRLAKLKDSQKGD